MFGEIWREYKAKIRRINIYVLLSFLKELLLSERLEDDLDTIFDLLFEELDALMGCYVTTGFLKELRGEVVLFWLWMF